MCLCIVLNVKNAAFFGCIDAIMRRSNFQYFQIITEEGRESRLYGILL